MYQRSSTGGLTAEELDGVLSQFEKNRKAADSYAAEMEAQVAHSMFASPLARFDRGMAAGYRLATEYIMAVVGWQCTEGCDQAALFVDTGGKRWCNDHLPDAEVTIAEHDDQRAAVDE